MLVAQFDSQLGIKGDYWVWSISKNGKVIGYIVAKKNDRANAIAEYLQNGCAFKY